jgi:hypothetical protein
MAPHYSHLDIPAGVETNIVGQIGTIGRQAESLSSVEVDELEPGTILTVSTQNSSYRFEILDASRRRARVVGGSMFQEPVEVRIQGSSAHGHVPKFGSISVGRRLELLRGDHWITTSVVEALALEDPVA